MSAKTLRFCTQPRQRATRRSNAATRVGGVEQIAVTRLFHTSSIQRAKQRSLEKCYHYIDKTSF